MSNTYTDHFPMPEDDSLPPLPGLGETGPQVCVVVQLYLGVLDDLAAEQVEILREHVRVCAGCAVVERLMRKARNTIRSLPASMPSARVDEAVREAIAARGKGRGYVASPVTGATQASPPRIHPAPALKGRFFGAMSDETAWEAAGYNVLADAPPAAWEAGPSKKPTPESPAPAPTGGGVQDVTIKNGGRSRRVRWRWGALAAAAMAAIVVLSFLAMTHFSGPGSTPQAFTLPGTLSWNGFVIYHSETRLDAHGARYQVDTYYDPATGNMHVETVMPGSMDVVAVGDGHTILGMDMMHQVAQWDASAWSSDESMFDLAGIRNDMKTSRAAFMDKDMFRGQAVYRIRCSNGLVLLLNMQYVPVNVLRGAVGPGTGEAVYDSLVMMPSSHVPDEMWDMHVPAGFKMGALPGRP